MSITAGPWTWKDDTTTDYYGATDDIRKLYGVRQCIHAIGQPWLPEHVATLGDDASPEDARLLEHAPRLHELVQWALENGAYSSVPGMVADVRALLDRIKNG